MPKMTIIKRDTHDFKVLVKDYSGNVFDLTGYNMKFIAKTNPLSEDVDADISANAAIEDPLSGIGVFSLTPVETDVAVKKDGYDYDVQISNGINKVYTVVKGKLTVEQDVRHAL